MKDIKKQRDEVLTRWVAIFESKWGRKESDEEVRADMRSMADIHPDDLDAACLRCLQECQFYPKPADIRARLERRHETESQEIKPIYLRPADGHCYRASGDDGKIVTEKDKHGLILRRVQRCGCKECDHFGWENWERSNSHKREQKPEAEKSPTIAKMEVMTPVGEIKSPVNEPESSPFWWENEPSEP